jgi:cytochrome c biogenesis factor
MNEILDQNPNKNTSKSNLYSKLAYACAYVFFIVPTFCFTFWPPKVKSKDLEVEASFINDLMTVIMITSFILGIIFTIVSFKRKEKLKYFKKFVIITISSIISLMIIANAIDLYKFTK